MDIIFNALIGIPIGIISGLYSALIVARYQRFADIRSQVLRVIREIEFIDEGEIIDFPRRKNVPELFFLASDFLFLKHRIAGETTLLLASGLNTDIYQASNGRIDYTSFEIRYNVWLDAGRSLKPSKLQLFHLWLGL